MDFCGFTKVNPYPIYRLSIFKFSIKSNLSIYKLNFYRSNFYGSNRLNRLDWIMNTPNYLDF